MTEEIDELLDFAESSVKIIDGCQTMTEQQKIVALIDFSEELLLMCIEALIKY